MVPPRLLVVSAVLACPHGPIAAKRLCRRRSVTTATDTMNIMRRLNVSSEFGAAVERGWLPWNRLMVSM